MLGALIAAVRDADDGAGLVAVLPVVGQTLVERQARLAAAAGASHLVVLVERLPAALTAAIDRLRDDGLSVEVARSPTDGADRFHPDERVLVFADGALADAGCIARLAALAPPALLTLGEGGPPGGWERIDAATRWSGVALVSGDMLRRTVAMLGDWDLHSTLLRRAAAAGAHRLDVADGAGLGEAAPVTLVRSRAGARAAGEASLPRDAAERGWPARLIYGRLARLVLPLLLDRPVEARWLRWGGVVASLAAVPAAWRGWLAVALPLLVLGALLDVMGGALARVRLMATRADRPRLARLGAIALAALAFAAHRLPGGTTPVVLAVAAIAAAAAERRERSILTAAGAAGSEWGADPDALVLLIAVAAVADAPVVGMALAAAYAAASFADLQARLARLVTAATAPPERV